MVSHMQVTSKKMEKENSFMAGKRKLGGCRERAIGEVEVVRLSCPTPL